MSTFPDVSIVLAVDAMLSVILPVAEAMRIYFVSASVVPPKTLEVNDGMTRTTGFSLSTGFTLRTAIFTTFALSAFAANSVLCRLALGDATIDAASFSAMRLFSGALVLLLIVKVSGTRPQHRRRGTWKAAAMLFLYAVAFSFAYISLTAGTGALILFGAVQATMVLAGLREGERFGWLQWAGLVIALSGLIYLMLPGWQAPTPWGAALMITAGIAWGVYSLLGRGVADPVAVTADNFMRSVPMVMIVALAAMPLWHASPKGALLAFVSGAVTSGLGYVVWYAALRELTATRAATAQLLVPVIAALGGVVFLSEPVSARLVISSVMIIGGVGLIFFLRHRSKAAIQQKQITVPNKGVCNDQGIYCSTE